MFSQAELQQRLDVDCIHEVLPPIPSDTESLYQYARYHDLHRLWKGKIGGWNDLAKYYRIAAANGNYKANKRLQYLLYSNRIITENNKKEVINLNEQLEKLAPASAYYGYFVYLSKGYGVKVFSSGEYSYLRKAVDLGNKEAQYAMAEILGQIKDDKSFQLRSQLWRKLYQCASDQRMGKASLSLGIISQIYGMYDKALNVYQQGVRSGSAQSALRLYYGFRDAVPPEKKYDYLPISRDPERAKRYEMIENYLDVYSYLQPTVPDLDEIVPLPPAKLPPWDGKIAFQRWFEGPSPQKPSDELMQKLAEKAGLDWQTGLPLKK
ncbi:DUF6396 domain-containing protein [Avibacterium volantium]|uniref:DUF6396 domain-containing protein n=1 Tax=Avibacterium TaxID=292486 RepID=UPI0039FC7435